MDSLVYHKQKESYYGPDILDSYPPLFLATEADTAEAACHQKARQQQHTELGRWLQTQAAPALVKAGAESPWAQQQLSLRCFRQHRPIYHHFPRVKIRSNNQEYVVSGISENYCIRPRPV